MSTPSWDPHGEALRDYFFNKEENHIRIHYRDEDFADLPVEIFFRDYEELPDIEVFALELCMHNVLDIGAGSGCHAIWLQEEGLDVTGLDISPGAVDVMKAVGLKKTAQADVMTWQGGPFYTLLMLMNGIGFVEDLNGLDRFLVKAKSLMMPEGQLILDSSDIRVANDLSALHGANYFGETELKMEYKGQDSGWLKWLYVDPDTLKKRATKLGWDCEVLFEGEEGRYLARLILQDD